jgi:hypothetical protein
MKQQVSFFKSYPFKKNQKIRIEDSQLKGDWEVIDITPYKITLRCPISKKELKKDRFCFFVEEKEARWPQPD